MRDVSYSLHEKATCSVCLANNMSHKQELGEEKYFLLLALSFNRIFTLYSYLYGDEECRDNMTLQNFEVVQASGNAPC